MVRFEEKPGATLPRPVEKCMPKGHALKKSIEATCHQVEEVTNDNGHLFGDDDKEGVQYPNDDALVVTVLIANFITRRILIDNDNSTNILF